MYVSIAFGVSECCLRLPVFVAGWIIAQVCRRIDALVMQVSSEVTLNANVELRGRGAFVLFPFGVTEFLLQPRRIDGSWYVSILRHLWVVLCGSTSFFLRPERLQVASAIATCLKVHASLRHPVLKTELGLYQDDINSMLDQTVAIATSSTASDCASIKYHWPRHWGATRRELGCAADEKSLERKLGEAYKPHYR